MSHGSGFCCGKVRLPNRILRPPAAEAATVRYAFGTTVSRALPGRDDEHSSNDCAQKSNGMLATSRTGRSESSGKGATSSRTASGLTQDEAQLDAAPKAPLFHGAIGIN